MLAIVEITSFLGACSKVSHQQVQDIALLRCFLAKAEEMQNLVHEWKLFLGQKWLHLGVSMHSLVPKETLQWILAKFLTEEILHTRNLQEYELNHFTEGSLTKT